jgi:uncharacterized membrane protein YcaP (DUF421 family)
LSADTLLSAIRKQNFDSFDDVKLCKIQPNGSFVIEGKKPSREEADYAALMAKLNKIESQLAALQR